MKKLLGIIGVLAVAGGIGWDQIKTFMPRSVSHSLEQAAQEIQQNKHEETSTLENTSETSAPSSSSKKMDIGLPAFLTDRPEEVIWHPGYTVSFNSRTRLPNWVAWCLTEERTHGNEKRADEFQPDPYVKKGHTAEDTDYRRSGYDRGHMCPAADNKYDREAMTTCFYFSNICPQIHALNGGDWKELEEKSRKWARRFKAIYITCGPILNSKKPKTIGRNRIPVPDAFYKVVMRQDKEGHFKAIGFVFKHKKQNLPLEQYAMSVDEVEEMTGIDFFSRVPDHEEKRMEANYNWNDWK